MADTNGTATGHSTSPGFLRAMSALVSRALLASRMGWMFQGERRIQEVLGYKAALCYADYKAWYERGDIAQRLVKAYPEATWSHPPTIQEDDAGEADTPFEVAWQDLSLRLGLFAKLERADILANLGQYSVLLIGLRGQSDLHAPAQRVRSADDVLYLTPYSEEFADIAAFDVDPGSPTFGQPSTYTLNFARAIQASGRLSMPTPRGTVHASRVLHVAEDLLDDEVYGLPRLMAVMNKLDDLLKVVGGSAEMFWRDAKRRIALELREGYRLEAAEEDTMSDEVAEYMHGLKDFIRVKGVDVENLSGLVASPKDHFDILLNVIAGATGIPKLLLMGSEAGELSASTEAQKAWLRRVNRRQQQYAEARMLRPLIDRLIALGALPEPANPYSIIWDNLFALSEGEQAIIAKDVATAAATMSPGMPERVLPLPEFRERFWGLSPQSEYESELPDMAPEEEENGDLGDGGGEEDAS